MTSRRRVARAPTCAIACALALLAAGVTPAFAAIIGSLTPAAARAGDWVVLTTNTAGGDPNMYAAIATAGPLPVFLQRADLTSAGNSCDTRVGDMTWAGGVGTARFQLRAVSPGTYWILAAVQGGCWRFGDGEGVLTLTVLPGGDMGPSPALLAAAVASAAAVIVGVLLIHRRRLLD